MSKLIDKTVCVDCGTKLTKENTYTSPKVDSYCRACAEDAVLDEHAEPSDMEK